VLRSGVCGAVYRDQGSGFAPRPPILGELCRQIPPKVGGLGGQEIVLSQAAGSRYAPAESTPELLDRRYFFRPALIYSTGANYIERTLVEFLAK